MKFDPYLIFYQLYAPVASFPYWNFVFLALFALFILFLLGKSRHYIFHFHKRGATFGFFLGIILMLFINAILILGMADRNKLQNLISAKEKRETLVSEVLVSGLNNLNKVLGVSTMVTGRKPKNAEEVVNLYMSLPDEESARVKTLICPR